MDYAALRNELTTNPAGMAYAGKTDAQLADLLNATNTGRTLPRKAVSKSEILNAVANADYPTAAETLKWNKLNLILSLDTVDASNANIVAVFSEIFAGKASLGVLGALASVTVSRATEIGIGPVTAGDVSLAKGGVW